MAVVTIRLDDETKNDLEALARSRGQSVSEVARSALERLLERPSRDDGELPDISPTSLTAVERQQLALLHRILARVVGDENGVDGDKAYQLQRAEILEQGFVGEYPDEFIGIRPELSLEDTRFVVDVLNMFRVLTASVAALRQGSAEADWAHRYEFEFIGFDGNDPRESRLRTWARYLISDRQWAELNDVFSEHDDGNSHSPMAAVYARMLDEYNRIQATRRGVYTQPADMLMSADELGRVARAWVHPDNR